MGRHRKLCNSPAELSDLWDADKEYCDKHTAVKTEFCQRSGEFITATIPAPITYTIEGFCVRNHISRQSFYEYYADNPKYADIVTRMRAECESNVRERFESGEIPTQLSALWMSKFGYTTKTDANVTGALPVVIDGGDELED